MADDDDLMWTVATTGAAVAAAAMTKKLMAKGWTARTGKAPGNPAAGDTTWSEALTWAVLSGVVLGVVRLLAQRGVAGIFEKRRGGLPAKASTEPAA